MIWVIPFLIYIPVEIQTLLLKNQFENIALIPEPMEIAYFKVDAITMLLVGKRSFSL